MEYVTCNKVVRYLLWNVDIMKKTNFNFLSDNYT